VSSTVTNLVVGAAALLALGVSGYRWLRVAQREHYIAGSCAATARRWITTRQPNAVLAAASVALLGLAVGVDRWFAVPAAALAGAFPWPMPLRGTPPLAFTRRATTLAGGSAIVAAVAAIAVGLATSWPVGLTAAAVLVPVLVDAAAAVAAPLERRALERHRAVAERRLRQVDPFVIAVTGSWGKTSTKNHIRDLLAGVAEVVASPASWNNTAGLSRTVNEHLTDTTEVLVAEMGTYGPGEIRDMCRWVRPRVGVICAIGPMHLERMRTIDTIVAAKSEILSGVDTAILWVDDPHLAALADGLTDRRVVRVGTRGGQGLDVEVHRDGEQLVVWSGGEVIGSLPAEGGPHPGNLGCAVAAALAYGATSDDVSARLAALTQPSHRATVGTNDAGVIVIDDTFNSNPAGARAAVERLTTLVSGRRAVVTPGMIELGPVQDEENERLARAVVESGATLIAVGWTNRRALVRGGGPDIVTLPSRDAARAWIRTHLGQGDGVLWENDLPDHYP
jgi:UDP-N-acetylmuramoyl-tripeptide--D-alanyl-D-alanine ligase